MILGWSPFKSVSVQSLVEIGTVVSEERIFLKFHPPFFLICIIGQNRQKNCSILSQKVPKFELYKHNDELFNMYYGIFYELWTFAYFDRLCKLEKGIFSHSGHLGYRTVLTDTILKGDHHPRIISAWFGWDWPCITGFFMNFELLPILTDYAN
jgi:hypothetical protein